MALIKCTNCGQMMSDKALDCPKCGCPNPILNNKVKAEYTGMKQPSTNGDRSSNALPMMFGVLAYVILCALSYIFLRWFWSVIYLSTEDYPLFLIRLFVGIMSSYLWFTIIAIIISNVLVKSNPDRLLCIIVPIFVCVICFVLDYLVWGTRDLPDGFYLFWREYCIIPLIFLFIVNLGAIIFAGVKGMNYAANKYHRVMALIKCEECGQMISDNATECPKCGTPMEKRPETPVEQENYTSPQNVDKLGSKKNLIIILLSVVIVAIVGIGFYWLLVDYAIIDQKSQEVSSDFINGHEYVDLGLSVKWATCNVGASSPSDYGNYYAWGETRTKSEYIKENSVTYDKNMEGIAGNSNYDAARANWGGTWRLPTASETEELINKCRKQWTTRGGHKGAKFTGPNGNSIFLPAGGWREGSSLFYAGEHGYYWSATPSEAYGAYDFDFDSGSSYYGGSGTGRSGGRPIRPVSE